jgi:hypothetical protein
MRRLFWPIDPSRFGVTLSPPLTGPLRAAANAVVHTAALPRQTPRRRGRGWQANPASTKETGRPRQAPVRPSDTQSHREQRRQKYTDLSNGRSRSRLFDARWHRWTGSSGRTAKSRSPQRRRLLRWAWRVGRRPGTAPAEYRCLLIYVKSIRRVGANLLVEELPMQLFVVGVARSRCARKRASMPEAASESRVASEVAPVRSTSCRFA